MQRKTDDLIADELMHEALDLDAALDDDATLDLIRNRPSRRVQAAKPKRLRKAS